MIRVLLYVLCTVPTYCTSNVRVFCSTLSTLTQGQNSSQLFQTEIKLCNFAFFRAAFVSASAASIALRETVSLFSRSLRILINCQSTPEHRNARPVFLQRYHCSHTLFLPVSRATQKER